MSTFLIVVAGILVLLMLVGMLCSLWSVAGWAWRKGAGQPSVEQQKLTEIERLLREDREERGSASDR